MADFIGVASSINSNLDSAIDNGLAPAFNSEEDSMDIVSVINQVRSSEARSDVLSTFTLESQAMIVAMITAETAELQSLQETVTAEGEKKQAEAEEAARKKAEEEAESEEPKG